MNVDRSDELAIVRFQDVSNRQCRLQESSLAGTDAVWFGLDGSGQPPMMLTRLQIKELLPHLKRFVKTGEL